ncbi:Unknown protein [Striga hermonthica]|uniref:CCHC-type domain-containing protein n=1 Tax=Striga hermonthica TaxID=68872 RepID=A0A9N7NQ57_STRHE|nr:Unknown protein [Striga hermonthica]
MAANKIVSEIVPIMNKITDVKLNGSNFLGWSKTIIVHLRSIDKDDHLDSGPPTDDVKYDTNRAWLRDDAKLLVQIRNSIEPDILSLVNHCEFVKELMDYLTFLYSGRTNISRIYSVCKSFHRGEQQDKNATAYVMEFNKVYEELNSLLPLSNDVKAMQKQREQISVMSFLTGLRPEFDGFKNQLLSESAIPSLQETFSRFLRTEEMQSPTIGTHISQHSAMVSRGASQGVSRGGSRRGSRGGSRGGTRGGPTNRGSRNPESDQVECYYCHELGHTKYSCPQLEKKNQKGPSAHVASSSDMVTISAEEYSRLTATEKPSSSASVFADTGNSATCLISKGTRWVIDSGASDHMTGNPNLFSTLDPHTPSSHVTIADGSTTRVLGSGSDLSTKQILGEGHESDGLYVFETPTSKSLVCTPSSSALDMHCRLGHPSLHSLKKLDPQFSRLSSLFWMLVLMNTFHFFIPESLHLQRKTIFGYILLISLALLPLHLRDLGHPLHRHILDVLNHITRSSWTLIHVLCLLLRWKTL